MTTQAVWTRIVLALVGLPNVVAGVWAALSPQGWYDNFPGWAPRVVAAYPPFNEHLVTDAGAGLFASGIVLCIAVLWPKREVMIMATLAFLAFALPHTLYHVANPADALTASEDAMSSVGLAVAVVGVAAVLMWQWRRPFTEAVTPT